MQPAVSRKVKVPCSHRLNGHLPFGNKTQGTNCNATKNFHSKFWFGVKVGNNRFELKPLPRIHN
jgi:hypothetical protein